MNTTVSEFRGSVRAPGPPGALGVRTLVRFAADPLGLLRQVTEQYGDVISMKMLGKPTWLVNHPDDIEALLVKHARIMARDDGVVVLERVLGQGLLTSDGELWKRQRKLMAEAFTPKRIHSYGAAMARVGDASLRSWRNGAVINVHREMSRVTMDVVAAVLFGANLSEAEQRMVSVSMDTINEFLANSPEAIAQSVVGVPAWIPTPRNFRVARAVSALDELVFRIISERRGGKPIEDLLGTLLAAKDEEGSSMTDKQLRDETMTLFLAGHETTALMLANTLYLLSCNPDVERKLYAEVAHVLGGRIPTADDVRALPYTDRVLKEAMRLLPPVWATGRKPTEDVEIRGHVIPKGSQILFSQWVVHHDRRWFPNPEGFDPDRWTAERSKDLPRYAYFPFGGGPRTCIGNHFATMEAALLLAMIVQKWKLELLPGQTLELTPSVTLRPKGPGLRMHLTERFPVEPVLA